MTELGTPDHLTRIIEIDEQDITAGTRREGGTPLKQPITESDLIRGIKNHFRPYIESAKTQAIEPTENLEQGFKLAQQQVNEIRLQLGLPAVDDTDMQVTLIPENKFSDVLHTLRGLLGKPDVVQGFAVEEFDSVFISAEEGYPDYLISSNAFHELVHKWLERSERVYAITPNKDKTQEQYRYRVYTENRRDGLSYQKIQPYFDGELIGEEKGDLLNEIGNYGIQKLFIDRILQPGLGMFVEEANKRTQSLSEHLHNAGIRDTAAGIHFTTRIREKIVEFDLDASNMHYKDNGEPIYDLPFVAMQFATDLGRVCGDVDGTPFINALIAAKVDPQMEFKIHNIIKTKMGEDFFNRLMDADLDDVGVLLGEVQSKMSDVPTIPPSS